MLVAFLAKRTAVLVGVAAAVSFFCVGIQPLLLVGLVLGALVAVHRVRMNTRMLAAASMENGSFAKRALPVIGQFLSIGILVVSVLLDIWLFAGVTIGLLLVPLCICINAVTEKLGLTHNGWGQKD